MSREETLKSIIQFIENVRISDRPNLSLLIGDTSVVLIQGVIKIIQSSESDSCLEANILTLARCLEKTTGKFDVTYGNGLAGFCWLLSYFRDMKLIEIEEESFFATVDPLLDKALDYLIIDHSFDLLHGFMGVGLYFLKRNKYKQVEKVLSALIKTVKVTDNEAYWFEKSVSSQESRLVDLSLPHGNAGILYFLIKCYNKNALPNDFVSLLKKSISFYLNNIQKSSIVGSIFPNSIVFSQDKKLERTQMSRIAWCYGDLSILYTLNQVASTLNLENERTIIKELLLQTAQRKDSVNTKILDNSICHGYSGVALIYLMLSRMPEFEIMNETFEFWKDRTIDFFNKNQKVLLSNHSSLSQANLYDINLHIGISGVALMMIMEETVCLQNPLIKMMLTELLFLS